MACTTFRSILRGATALLVLLAAGAAPAAVPVRISVKFILDANDNRPATGDVNTDQDVRDHVDRANQILAGVGSELRVELVEIVDVAGADQFYSSPIDASTRDAIRNAGQMNPNAFAWRDDAVNYYVNGDTGSAIADFPSDNEIVLVGQRIFDTTFLHELGHILDVFHTHETNGGGDGDSCDDTISDMSSWSRDDIASNNFGDVYANLQSWQQGRVDAVWDNVMSYHDGDNRSFFTNCQMGRKSAQSWRDRSWLLARLPLYVDSRASAGGNSGSWGNPFATLDEAIAAGGLAGRALVLLDGYHTMTLDLDADDLEVVSRRGPATIRRDISPWEDAVDPAASGVPAVADAMRAVQAADRAGDGEAALAALRRAKQHATGKERIAIRLELGQRLRQAGRHDAAIAQYERVAEETGSETLRRHARHWIARSEEARQNAGTRGRSDERAAPADPDRRAPESPAHPHPRDDGAGTPPARPRASAGNLAESADPSIAVGGHAADAGVDRPSSARPAARAEASVASAGSARPASLASAPAAARAHADPVRASRGGFALRGGGPLAWTAALFLGAWVIRVLGRGR